MAVKKKSQISQKVRVPGQAVKKKRNGRPYRTVEFVAIGADVSTYSMSLAGITKTKDGKTRVAAVSKRWTKQDDYFSRMRDAAKAHDLVHELFIALKVSAELGDAHFALEEPVSYGHLQRKQSQTIKQQCQISGAFIGGLLRWGWNQLYEIQANQWRKVVADDLAAHHGIDFTIAAKKWNDPEFLAFPRDFHYGAKSAGKYRAQQWAVEIHPKWDGGWPDIISDNALGMIPRPEGRKAAGVQPDDRYDALPMAEWMRREILRSRA